MKHICLILLVAACGTDPQKPDLPSCVDMGCDGTQNVPLYCPMDGDPGADEAPADGACFCAAPDGPDGWCYP